MLACQESCILILDRTMHTLNGHTHAPPPFRPTCPPLPTRCHHRYAEMGSSAVVLKAGYNLGSLMLRYQGVDWRDTANWGCNAA